MQHLALVALHDDGEHVVLKDADGHHYLLGIDEALRAAVRRDRAHLGQLRIEIGGKVRPREIQARIRAGATAQDVADATGWPVEKVNRYEGPILAEREHVAELARAVRLRRRGGPAVTLGDEVKARLSARDVDPDQVQWDSWRTDQGPWTVVVSFTAAGRERQARWHFDLAGRSVVPADDEARWLSEQSVEGDGPLGGVHLTAVPVGSVYDIEADGGVDGDIGHPGRSGERTQGRSAAGRAADSGSGTLDLMTAMRNRRREREHRRPGGGRREPTPDPVDPADVPGPTHPARRGRRTSAPEPLEFDPALMADPPAAHPRGDMSSAVLPPDDVIDDETPETRSRPSARRWPLADLMQDAPDDTAAPPEPATEPAAIGPTTDEPTADEPATVDLREEPSPDEPTDEGRVPRHRAPAKSKARRASVPSWDDIMFGAKRD